jgi:hypothetical protein
MQQLLLLLPLLLPLLLLLLLPSSLAVVVRLATLSTGQHSRSASAAHLHATTGMYSREQCAIV